MLGKMVKIVRGEEAGKRGRIIEDTINAYWVYTTSGLTVIVNKSEVELIEK